MASDLYCSRADVNRRLPIGSIVSPGGIVASASSSTSIVTLNGHGFDSNDQVTVRALDGGALSAPLVEGTVYYVIRLTNSTFKLAATSGGAAITLTSDGVSMIVERDPDFDTVIEFYSRWTDSFLPDELVPLQAPIHPLVKGLVADLSAKRMLNMAGQDSAALTATELASKAQLERFVAGLPLRGASGPGVSNAAITSTLGTIANSRGWPSGSLP